MRARSASARFGTEITEIAYSLLEALKAWSNGPWWPVDDSWFSPNYHQLSPTIIYMVKRPKKFVIVNNSSPAVAQAKSREQVVVIIRKNVPKRGRASYSSVRRNIRSLVQLTALPILPDERLAIRFFAVSLLIVASFSLRKTSSLCYLGLHYFFVMIIVLKINMNLWSWSWASWGIFDGHVKLGRRFLGITAHQNLSWTITRVVKRDKLSSIITHVSRKAAQH